ncbi:hypothetical protein HELRODRAFT_170255 [Helobdella robusta]|uniref:PiggyBac transposable element-derived protein domain-containing protein n=1 Tax=Helobdella robusta TaxID=6412 RepID=T1F2U3_HELRO|nr:hypothetical protein HELRODRAFT_170255 [Helobdella robusta]ESO07714.1 hypothetical protein HELRODRAFT_170255 [Helobdella robusta]
MAYSERFTLEQAKQLIIDNSSDEESISEHEEITDYSDVEFTDEKGNEPFLVEDSADDDDEIKYTLQSSNVQNDSSNSDLGSSDESNDNEKSKTFVSKCGNIVWQNEPVYNKCGRRGRKSNDEKEKNQAQRVVLDLSENLKGSGRNITCDNFFTSLSLIQMLKKEKLTLLRTSRINFGHKDDLVETKIPAILSKSGRCHACPRIKDKKTALKCSKCNKPTCRDHVFMICRNCSTN